MKLIEIKALKGLSGKYGIGLPAGRSGMIDGDRHPIDKMVADGDIEVIATPPAAKAQKRGRKPKTKPPVE